MYGFIYDITNSSNPGFPDLNINNPAFVSSSNLKVLTHFTPPTGSTPANGGSFFTSVPNTLLDPGTYVLMFGGGNGLSQPMLGATGRGTMAGRNTPNASAQDILWIGSFSGSGSYNSISSETFPLRFAFTGTPVPEPSTYLILGSMVVLAMTLLRKKPTIALKK